MSFWNKYQIYIYVVGVALLTWWLQQVYEQRQMEMASAKNSPDFFSSKYYKKSMDMDGKPKSELLADKMQHYKANGNTTHLEKPVMTLYNANVAPWVIQAEGAIMAGDGDHLQLKGRTIINREASEGGAALKITTADLQVILSKNFAKTSAWADIVSPPNQTSGTGMEVTFVSPIHLKLLSKVKGRYEIK